MNEPLLVVQQLGVDYRIRQGLAVHTLRALDDISFELQRGSTLGVVGESGSGKSTLARALLRLLPVTRGRIRLGGADLLSLEGPALRALRPRLQMIFQDAQAALDPRLRIGAIVAEPLREFRPQLSAVQRQQQVEAMLARVGLRPELTSHYPHELSGGQAQRVGIARALMLQPELLVCDEPLSALDVSVKSQISNLLKDLQQHLQLSMIFISHDLAAVRFSADRLLVLYLGRVMELAPADLLYRRPLHPYTRALLAAVPRPDPQQRRHIEPLAGEIPSPLDPPSGCVFRTRCPLAIARCAIEQPALQNLAGAQVACHRAGEQA